MNDEQTPTPPQAPQPVVPEPQPSESAPVEPPVAAPVAPVAPPVPPAPEGVQGEPKSEGAPEGPELTGVDSNKLMAAISYLGLLVIVPILVAREDKFTMWHAKQGVLVLIGYVVASILSAVGPLSILGSLFWLAMIIVSVVGFVQALQGKWWELPVVGKFAKNFKF